MAAAVVIGSVANTRSVSTAPVGPIPTASTTAAATGSVGVNKSAPACELVEGVYNPEQITDSCIRTGITVPYDAAMRECSTDRAHVMVRKFGDSQAILIRCDQIDQEVRLRDAALAQAKANAARFAARKAQVEQEEQARQSAAPAKPGP